MRALLQANKMHGTFKYGGHCDGQKPYCKNRATLGRECCKRMAELLLSIVKVLKEPFLMYN